MRKVRVFVDAPLAAGALLALPAFAAEHLTRVLRLGDGAAVTCFNGDGHDYPGVLRARGRETLFCATAREPAGAAESSLQVTLAQCVARGEKMDSVLQKATELGVAAIVPLVSERTEVRLDEDRAGRRLAHWQRVLHSACEQCGRAVLPRLHAPVDLPTWAAGVDASMLRLVLDPDGDEGLSGLAAPQAPVIVVVGPEGGLSARDHAALAVAGFQRLRLGPRVLRTETAGPAVLAALQARFGDL
jgi:16S rRNA (uracil1498-N3)-methyltransferase